MQKKPKHLKHYEPQLNSAVDKNIHLFKKNITYKQVTKKLSKKKVI